MSIPFLIRLANDRINTSTMRMVPALDGPVFTKARNKDRNLLPRGF